MVGKVEDGFVTISAAGDQPAGQSGKPACCNCPIKAGNLKPWV